MKRLNEYLKEQSDANRIPFLHPMTMRILCEFIEYCDQKKLPCMITDTITTTKEDSSLQRVSDTHRTARAFDGSLKGWTSDQRIDCLTYFNGKYPQLGAISPTDGKPYLVIAHDAGTGLHLHFQIRRDLALPTLESFN